jgi:demethylmenaquinone methyltransferase/2-methoxy-6-polyprenyl-1,4-benzoquinol methylase
MKQEQITRRYNLWSRGPLYQIGSFGALGPWERKVRTEAVRALQLSSGASVLDVASGTGANLPFLEEAVGPTGSIVAVDFNPSMLARARARAENHGWGNVRFVELDAAAMTFDKEFDGALCTLGLSVIPRWRDALKAMVAAVRPGGRVAVMDAQYLKGARRILNPYIRLMDLIAGSEVSRDLKGALRELVSDFQVSEYVFGAIFVASGVVSGRPTRREG